MGKHIKNFMESFNRSKDFIYLFLADIITFSLIFVIFSWFTTYIQNKSLELMNGKTPQEFQEILSSSNPEQILPFLNELRSFLIWAILGVVMLALFSFLLYSLSRALIWNHLNNKKVSKKNYWRWNLLNLSLIIPLILFFIVFFFIRIIVSVISNIILTLAPVFFAIHSTFAQNFQLILNGIVSFYLVLLFLVIIFLIYHKFTKSYRVWDSLGGGFKLFKGNWGKLSILILFSTISALILSLVGIVIKRSIYTPNTLMFFNLALAAIFLAWLRLYVLRTINHEDH